MANIEYIVYEYFDASLDIRGKLVWEKQAKEPINGLPQIFWDNGCGWHEANLWALDRASSNRFDAETIKRTMKHVCRYANFIETHGFSWRHFPVRKEEQVLRRFRRHLINAINDGTLMGSTAANCMSTVVQFYRFAEVHDLVGSPVPMWTERLVVIPWCDATGFKRSIARLSSDLSIPNRMRLATTLEEGLLPLRKAHMSELLVYTSEHETQELHLMLSIGFFTGARVGTVTTLTVSSLQTAREDPNTPGFCLLPVGPGTKVATKFSVTGDLLIPKTVLAELRIYAYSSARLLREAKAELCDKDALFLTRNGRPYTVETVNRLVYQMRNRAVASGLIFMERFKFHQSRATFGTWLMELLLECGPKTDAIRIVRDAMFHKNEKTTFGYIRFLENTRTKQQAAAAFNEAFTGISGRDWNNTDA